MADARLNVFADAVVAAVRAGLAAGDDTDVKWSISPEVLAPDFDPAAIARRTVYVVPVTRKQVGDNSRGTDEFEYAVSLLTASRFAGAAGDPPDEWVRGEMAWHEAYVDDRLSNERTEKTAADVLATFAWCARSEPEYAYEADALQTQRMFYSAQSFAFRRAE